MVLTLIGSIAAMAYAAVTVYRKAKERDPVATAEAVKTVRVTISVVVGLSTAVRTILDALGGVVTLAASATASSTTQSGGPYTQPVGQVRYIGGPAGNPSD